MLLHLLSMVFDVFQSFLNIFFSPFVCVCVCDIYVPSLSYDFDCFTIFPQSSRR